MEQAKRGEPLKPNEIALGNFIESFGKTECITGITQEQNGVYRVGHTGWNKGLGFIPEDVTYSTYPIVLTDDWKICLGIEKYKLPEWVKYVHEAQNYFFWALRINLHEIIDWDLLPSENVVDV